MNYQLQRIYHGPHKLHWPI